MASRILPPRSLLWVFWQDPETGESQLLGAGSRRCGCFVVPATSNHQKAWPGYVRHRFRHVLGPRADGGNPCLHLPLSVCLPVCLNLSHPVILAPFLNLLIFYPINRIPPSASDYQDYNRDEPLTHSHLSEINPAGEINDASGRHLQIGPTKHSSAEPQTSSGFLRRNQRARLDYLV